MIKKTLSEKVKDAYRMSEARRMLEARSEMVKEASRMSDVRSEMDWAINEMYKILTGLSGESMETCIDNYRVCRRILIRHKIDITGYYESFANLPWENNQIPNIK